MGPGESSLRIPVLPPVGILGTAGVSVSALDRAVVVPADLLPKNGISAEKLSLFS
jgi:hypothetical protein